MVPRVFKQKKDQLMKDLISGEILGNQFQKRGLPHAHIPIILANYERTMTPEDVARLCRLSFPQIQTL